MYKFQITSTNNQIITNDEITITKKLHLFDYWNFIDEQSEVCLI